MDLVKICTKLNLQVPEEAWDMSDRSIIVLTNLIETHLENHPVEQVADNQRLMNAPTLRLRHKCRYLALPHSSDLSNSTLANYLIEQRQAEDDAATRCALVPTMRPNASNVAAYWAEQNAVGKDRKSVV